MKSSTENARVEDTGDLVLLFSFGIDDRRGWGWGDSGWQGVGVVGFEERSMEDGMNVHGRGEGEAECRASNSLDDGEGA